LGAATASVGREGKIVVRVPVSNGRIPLSRQNSVLMSTDYVWNGKTYLFEETTKASHYRWDGTNYQIIGK
jgi:hypothetical protein